MNFSKLRRSFVFGLWLAATTCFGAQTLGPEQPPALTTLSQLSGLTQEEAAKGVAVKLKGTVTFCDRDRGSLFIQEGTEGVAIRLPANRTGDDFDFQPGQLVEVEGTTIKGRVRCSIRGKSARVIGVGQMPTPLEVAAGTALSEQAESRFVSCRGWVPTVTTIGNRLTFPLVLEPGRTIDVTVATADLIAAKQLPGSLVEVSGAFSLKFDGTGRISGGRLYLNELGEVHKSRSLSIVPIAEAGAGSGKGMKVDPFCVRGTVLSHSLGEFLLIRDSSGSLRVPYRGLSYFNAGSLVEVFAYPLQQRPELLLTNITVKLVPADTSNEEPATAIITPNAANTNLITLTQVMQIRKLSPQEASRGYPVSISGVVTFFDHSSYLHFVQDETSGIYFDLNRVDNVPALRAGQRIKIQGFSGPGDYAPILIAQSLQLVKEDDFPTAQGVSLQKLLRGNFDSQWVLLKGVVRNQWIGTNSSTLALFAGDGLIKVLLPEQPANLRGTNLIDAGVEIRGVCRTIFDDHRRLQGVELEVPNWGQLAIREPSVEDPFTLPVRAISDLFQFHAEGSELHRARLMGVVTMRSADGSIYVQDASAGMQIQPGASTVLVAPGTMVDVVGFPVIMDNLVMLQEAIVHPVKNGTPIEPVDLKPEMTLEDTLQGTLVSLQGQVLGHFSHGTEELLTMRFGQRIVDVVLEKKSDEDQLADFEAGTIARATGIYIRPPANAASVQSFRVLIRTSTDLAVVARPTWWTMQRTLWALGGAATLVLLALGWVHSLRRQVHQRTRELHDEIEHHKATEAKLEAEIAERKRMEQEVERSHQELMTASRQAGMAEVATSVLHNVGNVLNSVNVSASLVADNIRKSKISNVARAAKMLEEHALDLPDFLSHDPKGRQLPQYLGRLVKHLETEQGALLSELDTLRKNVEHIKGIVVMQQSYAKVFGSAEAVKPTELVEDALRLNSGALVRHDVKVIREYEPDLPPITVEKHKLLQILVNLICNAKKACDESIEPERRLTVRVANGEGTVKISVIDNGVGIPAENLTRIFNHGFTTRKDGHGFGLHSGALAAKEMGGTLAAYSDGRGKGARFTLELPVETAQI